MSRGHPKHSVRLAGVVLAAALVCPGVAYAADEQEYDLVKTLVENAQHEQAVARSARLLDPASPVCPNTPDLSPQGCRISDPTIVRLVRGYYAIALQSTGKNEGAKEQFRAILKDNPTFSPSPAIYPIKTIDLFNEVKKEGQAAEIDRVRQQQAREAAAREAQRKYDAYVADLEKRASNEEHVVERSRWFAAVPFGVGQFYNDDIGLGVLFAAIEVSAITASIATGALHATESARRRSYSAEDKANFAKFSLKDPGVRERAAVETRLQQLQIANNVSMGVLAVALIAGFIEAQASFEPEKRRTVPRALPPKPPKPAPSVDVTGVPGAPGATGLGLQLTF